MNPSYVANFSQLRYHQSRYIICRTINPHVCGTGSTRYSPGVTRIAPADGLATPGPCGELPKAHLLRGILGSWDCNMTKSVSGLSMIHDYPS